MLTPHSDELKLSMGVSADRALAEQWLPCHGYEGLYEASSFGRIRNAKTLRVLAPSTDSCGYPMVSLNRDGRRRPHTLHRLIALTFHAQMRNVLHCEVAHLDGARSNARADNLKWVSKVENHSHKLLHGTHDRGERHASAKLTNLQAAQIRAMKSSSTFRQIADQFGVSIRTIQGIVYGKRYIADAGELAVGSNRADGGGSRAIRPTAGTQTQQHFHPSSHDGEASL